MTPLAALQQKLSALEVGFFLISNLENIHYLTGFSGSSGWLLVSPGQAVLLTDFRYRLQAKAQTSGINLEETSKPLEWLSQNAKTLNIRRLAFEAEHVSYRFYSRLNQVLSGTELLPLTNQVEELRLLKSPEELERIREAIKLAERVFEAVTGDIKIPVSELELAARLEFEMRCQGAEKASFDIIVASGPRSALPHGRASEKLIQPGETVVIDFGAVYQGYNCDITRTVVWGEPAARQQEIYDIVRLAQQRAIDAARPGITAGEVDQAARSVIQEAGFGDYFGHSTGHGVGLAVHEEPRISQGNNTVLAEGMVITIEPGIYLPDEGGVRIEDMVLITGDGHQVLTDLPRRFRI